VGKPIDLSLTADHSQLMELVISSIPETIMVRWVGVNNAQQIARHINAGYDFVDVDDGIVSVSGQTTTDASGRHIVIGDCVLMAVSKEVYEARRKRIQEQGAHRLAANLSGDEIKAAAQSKGMKLWEKTESMESQKP
jgi:hypothetical protein